MKRDYFEKNGQNQYNHNLNDSFRLNSQINKNNGTAQFNSQSSQNVQNSDPWNNFHQKTLSLKERLYRPSSNNLGVKRYSQENQNNFANNFESQFQAENEKFLHEQNGAFSNFAQNSPLQNSLQESLSNDTENNITRIEEDPEQREISIIENLHYIEQAEPVKLEVLRLLMDSERHPDCQLLREIKRNRYMGTVALGMILYNLIETFGSDMISKNYEDGNDIYRISERFSGLLERAFTI